MSSQQRNLVAFGRAALIALLSVACAKTPQMGTVPAVPPVPIVASGFASGVRNQSMGQTMAGNRARARLASLAAAQGWKLKITRVAGCSTVERSFAGSSSGPVNVRNNFPSDGDFISTASGMRPGEVDQALRALPLKQAAVTVPYSAGKLAQAVDYAERAAVRQIAQAALPAAQGSGMSLYEGHLSVADLQIEVAASEVTVRIAAYPELVLAADASLQGPQQGRLRRAVQERLQYDDKNEARLAIAALLEVGVDDAETAQLQESLRELQQQLSAPAAPAN